jgi:malate dehydrogenase
VLTDRNYLEQEFIPTVQQRGAAVIKARGASSAGSAANAIVDSVVSLTMPTPGDDWHSVALRSDGSYGVPEGLICSFPTRYDGGSVHIVPDVPLNEFAREKLALSVAELEGEKEMTAHLLP